MLDYRASIVTKTGSQRACALHTHTPRAKTTNLSRFASSTLFFSKRIFSAVVWPCFSNCLFFIKVSFQFWGFILGEVILAFWEYGTGYVCGPLYLPEISKLKVQRPFSAIIGNNNHNMTYPGRGLVQVWRQCLGEFGQVWKRKKISWSLDLYHWYFKLYLFTRPVRARLYFLGSTFVGDSGFLIHSSMLVSRWIVYLVKFASSQVF